MRPHGKRRGLLALVLLLFSSRIWAEGRAAEENAVKAAFLFHFAEFVEWPEGAFRDQRSPIVYCAVGESGEMWEAIQASLMGKTIRSRAVQLRRLKNWQGSESCHVLFVGQGEEKHQATALLFLRKESVLTVGESEKFAESGGIIEFCEESNKIRFHVNLTAANAARLKLSARLLSLAKSVTGTLGGN